MSGESRQPSRAPLRGSIGWSYGRSGWVIEVVDPTTSAQVTDVVVTMDKLPRMLRPMSGWALQYVNGVVFTHVGDCGQSTHDVLPALRAAMPAYQGRSIAWGHDPHLSYKL